MTGLTSSTRAGAIALVALGVAIGVWLALDSSRDLPETGGVPLAASAPRAAEKESTTTMPGPGEPTSPPADLRPDFRPDFRIEEGGRLSLDAHSMPVSGVVRFGLALDREAVGAGQDPLPAVVVSADDGRRLELAAIPVAGSQSGVRLDLDAAWLEPGQYMIQLRTAEKVALPLRRYVIEVHAPPAAETANQASATTP
jgi:hypothetical protein